MKIQIQSEETNMSIRIPNAVIFSKIGEWIINKTIRMECKNNSEIQIPFDEKQLHAFLKATKKIVKNYKGLEIVSVESKDEKIHIFL